LRACRRGGNQRGFPQSYVTGFARSCSESAATVMTDLRELGPTYFFAPPRIWVVVPPVAEVGAIVYLVGNGWSHSS
jgi:hypothetical protein